MTLILLCGQIGIGKTTYGQKLAAHLTKNLHEAKFIPLFHKSSLEHYEDDYLFYKDMIKRINQAIQSNAYEYIICAAPFYQGLLRQQFLEWLTIPEHTELIVIQLRPPYEQFIQTLQQNDPLLLDHLGLEKITSVYDNFSMAHIMEFEEFFNFDSIHIYVIDNYNSVVIDGEDELVSQFLV